MLPLLPNDAVSVQRERSDTVADASRAPLPEEGGTPEVSHDGAPPAMFLDRDHSILAFNERVRDWAHRPEVPVLERLRYLCIVSSNLDEFFQVRVGALHDRVEAQHLGIIHLAFGVDTMEAVDQKARELKENGFPILSGPRKTGDGYYEFETLDPDHNRIELTTLFKDE